MHYFAVWTDSGFLLGCSHEHETVVEADSCIPCAGGYVVAVENGVIRCLTEEEESEFQLSHDAHRPEVETRPAEPTEAAASGSGNAVMTRIRVGDRWLWTTWMRFQKYAEAAAHARKGSKVVRFRSTEWAALRQQTEPASPIVINAPRQIVPLRGKGETLVEFALRPLSAYGLDQHPEPSSRVKYSFISTNIIDLVLSRLSESETRELERVYTEDKRALMDALENRFLAVRESKRRCH